MNAFLVDRNVGRLVTWLRAFGFDAAFADDGDDGQLIKRALSEGRALVTKDRKLLERRVITSGRLRALPITQDNLFGQLREFFAIVPVDTVTPFTRCVRCNVSLESIEKTEVQAEVPAYVYENQEAFSRCPACHRVYWQGTHWKHMNAVLRGAAPHG